MFTPIKAIRKNCIDCCGGSPKEVTKCPSIDCYLFPFRLGKNPNRKGMGNPSAFLKKRGLKSEIILEGHNEDVSAKAYSNNKKTPT